jgi:hypothetical protein
MNTKISAVCLVLALAGCLDTSGTEPDVEATPKIASNGLVPTAIHSNGLGNAALTGIAIANARGMEDTADHRLFTAYLAGCALAPGQCVTSTYQGVQYNYCGVVDLAPQWTVRALTATEIKDVSACVLARANLAGINVQISIHGDNAQLGCTTDELAYYNLEEAAFYGDVFTGTAGAKHACNGVDQVLYGDTVGDLPNRQCGQPDPNNPGYTLCGFVFDGNCSDICSSNGDHYQQCASMGNVETVHVYGPVK